jgi:hypothetical protein
VAEKCCDAPAVRLTDTGLIAVLVNVWPTVTLVLLVVDTPLGSVIVTVNEYEPALLNVAVVLLAALFPLDEKVTPAGGVPLVAQAGRPEIRQ